MYQEVESIEELYKIVEQCLEEYNQTHKTQMNLVIFRSDTYLLYFIGNLVRTKFRRKKYVASKTTQNCCRVCV